MLRPLLLASLLFLPLVVASAQSQAAAAGGQSSVSGGDPSSTQAEPVVTFTLDFPGSQPEHYAIRVPSGGLAHYESNGRLNADSEADDTFDFDFAISSEMRTKIFALAAEAGYFQKDPDAHRKNIAFTGKKTLRYSDAGRTGESTYNYSANTAVQELTSLFQNLSATLEFGHRLDYDHHYQKLALNEELKRMEEMAHGRMLTELTAIQPILEKIVADQSVINVARVRAQRLLNEAGGH